MGCGSWDEKTFATYTMTKGRSVDSSGVITDTLSAQEMFVSRTLAPELNPYNVMRECCDSKEHPNTKPVILGFDVTGSMGSAAVKVAQNLNQIMTDLYNRVADVEFLVMGIGDLTYDRAPIQASQFESDIRIAEQLDKIYFEQGGGGNAFESYTAAWYFGLHHTKLDCWKRGQKGIIITMGDEMLNPHLPARALSRVTGDSLAQFDSIETADLYAETIKKFDVYHLAINDKSTAWWYYGNAATKSFRKYLDENHFKVVTLNDLAPTIVSIVSGASTECATNTTEAITW